MFRIPKDTTDERSANRAEMTRRDLFRSGAAFASVVLAPGVTLMAFGGSEADAAADAGKRWGLLIDVNKCSADCDDCVTACADENGWEGTGHPGTDAQWIRKVTMKNDQTGHEVSMPVMCQHCESPPCVDVCPTGASMKRADGIVLVDKHICIGCRYCMMACPFEARSFIHEPLTNQKSHAPRGQGTVESCTLCVHRVDRGGIPACVEACAKAGHHAIIFGDLNDPESRISQRLKEFPSAALRPDLDLFAGVRYQNL